jgi:hypothetical protein
MTLGAALDVLDFLERLKVERRCAYLLITHDLAVVGQTADDALSGRCQSHSIGGSGAMIKCRLKVGLMLPQIDGMRQRGMARWSDLKAMAQLAEDVGFDSLWLVDHFLYRLLGEDRGRGAWECWSLLAALAATTSKVELGTLVLGMGFRNPALLAKMADTVDEVSNGRLILGVGAGYHELEYRAFGYPYAITGSAALRRRFRSCMDC